MIRIIFIALVLLGCSQKPEEMEFRNEGNIIENGNGYLIILRPDTFPDSNVTIKAKLVKKFDMPLKKLRVPVSVQDCWEFETKECGILEFTEAITGHILCNNCRLNATYYKSCPSMIKAVDDFDWAIYD
tara:strand:+ start:1048 stop:1434 length:387 start_codon:yes stop_codon:yes gene_type:complete